MCRGRDRTLVAPPLGQASTPLEIDSNESLAYWLRSRRGAQGEAALLVVFVIVFSDSDRVGRGEWSRVYDACMVVRVYLSGLRAPCMPRRCLRRLETRHPYHLGGVFWYGSSISIIIYLSLIRGISSVADGENPQ